MINFKKKISNNSKTSIILDLMNKRSELDISKRNNLSTNTINQILHNILKDKLVKNNGHFPTFFGNDEFSVTKYTISKMTFIIVNYSKTSLTLLIVENP